MLLAKILQFVDTPNRSRCRVVARHEIMLSREERRPDNEEVEQAPVTPWMLGTIFSQVSETVGEVQPRVSDKSPVASLVLWKK